MADGLIRQRWDLLIVITAGGSLGSLGRWALGQALPHAASQLPISTWVANTVGSFALGALVVVLTESRPPHRYARPFWGVGVLGGFTTFSTYVLDAHTLLDAGQALRAAGYVVGTVVTGLGAAWVGVRAGRAGITSRSGQGMPRQAGSTREES